MLDLLNGFVVELRNAGLPGQPDREPRRDGGGAAHPDRGPRGVQVRARPPRWSRTTRHWRAFETVFEVYFSLRGPEYRIAEGDDDDLDELLPRDAGADAQGEGRARPAAAMDSLTPEEIAHLLMQALLNGDQAMMRALARQAVQRFAGMEPGRPGRRHVLPVPDAAQPRPRRDAREADGGHPRAGRRRADVARGAPRARRVPAPHRAVQERDRGRDPPPAGRRPGRRGDGQDAAQAAARGRRVHARLAATRCSRCARRCTR